MFCFFLGGGGGAAGGGGLTPSFVFLRFVLAFLPSVLGATTVHYPSVDVTNFLFLSM